MISTAQRRSRLWARHHLGTDTADVVEAVRDLVAMHSSDPLTPHLGAWARVAGYATEALHDALDGQHLWRMHAMRRTLWVVDRAEAPVFDGAAGRDVAAKERARLVGWLEGQQERVDAWLAALEEQALQAVADDPGVLTRTLTSRVPGLATKVTLGTGKWSQEAAIGSRLLFVLAMEGKLARLAPTGSWRSSQYGWLRTEGFGPVQTREDARTALLGRYLARFGPVTFTDMRWWTGWTVARVKKALTALGAIEVALESGTGWLLPDDAHDEVPEARGTALLPGLDPTPMGYKERDWYLGPHEGPLFDRNGNVGPTIWQDGRIVGGWAIDGDGRVCTRLLESADQPAIDAKAEALTAWLGGTSATPRFRTPLERELTA